MDPLLCSYLLLLGFLLPERIIMFALCVVYATGVANAFTDLSAVRPGHRHLVPCRAHPQYAMLNTPRCAALLASSSSHDINDVVAVSAGLTTSMIQHHTAMKTSNIEMSVAFYSLLDFYPVAKFKSGPARAAWLEHRPEHGDSGGRIELIEVPEDMLYGEDEDARKGLRKRAVDRMFNPALLGWDHICLDVTVPIQAKAKAALKASEVISPDEEEEGTSTTKKKGGLQHWIAGLNKKSLAEFGKDVRVALQPRVKLFGRERCEMAFIYDADGGLIELINRLGEIGENEDESTWHDTDDSRIIWRDG